MLSVKKFAKAMPLTGRILFCIIEELKVAKRNLFSGRIFAKRQEIRSKLTTIGVFVMIKSKKAGFTSFFLAAALIFGLRIAIFLQKGTAGTLFFSDGGILSLLTIICLFVGTVLIFVFFRGTKREIWRAERSVLQASAAVLCGACLIIQSIYAAAGSFTIETGLLLILGIAAGLSLVVLGCASGAGQNFYEDHPYLALLPCLWCAAVLVVQFRKNSAQILLPESLFLTIAFCFFLYFFFEQAKILCGIGAPSIPTFYRAGLAAALFGFSSSLPELCAMLFSCNPTGETLPGMHGLLFPLSLYVIVILKTLKTTPISSYETVLDFLEKEYEAKPNFLFKSGNH